MARKKPEKKRKFKENIAEQRKVAIVCDWLTNVGGAEKVLLRIHKLFPEAPIYTSQYDPKGIDWFSDADVRTGNLQKIPVRLRRFIGPLRHRYFSRLDLSGYDLVISVTGAEAKAVKVPNGVHVSYCHVPTQYYWQMYDKYVRDPGFGLLNPFVRFFFRIMVRPLRRMDLKSTRNVDYFITISEYAKDLVKKYYGKESVVIHPPVEVDDFNEAYSNRRNDSRADYFITTSRQVNWKRLDLAVRACLMTQRRLLVIGEGPEHKRLEKMAKNSGLVEFLPLMKKEELRTHLAGAKGYLFPSLEPFGIAPVEALATGCPVIAFKEGGTRDYIKEGENGILFEEQTAKSLAEAILRFDKIKFSKQRIVNSAKIFSEERFDKELKDYINEVLK